MEHSPVSDGLNSQPLDRQWTVRLLLVVVCLVNVLCQAKVTDLDHVVGGQEDISSRQIAVEDLQTLLIMIFFSSYLFTGKVLHTPGHLVGPAEQVLPMKLLHKHRLSSGAPPKEVTFVQTGVMSWPL